nr:hypothetical protein [Tanacetum cinerariifolium]
MLVIKRFSKRKKVFRERKKTRKIRAKRMVVKEIKDGHLEEMEKFGWWFEQNIDGEKEDDNEKNLVMMNEEGWTRKRRFEREKKSWNETILHHLHQQCHPTDEMRMDDLEWYKRSKHLNNEVCHDLITSFTHNEERRDA